MYFIPVRYKGTGDKRNAPAEWIERPREGRYMFSNKGHQKTSPVEVSTFRLTVPEWLALKFSTTS